MLRSRPTGISLTDREIYSRLGHIMIEQAILSELENLDVSDSTSYELESEASAPSSTPSQSRGFVYGIDSSEKVKSCYNKAPSPGPPLESQPNVTTSHSIQAIKPGEATPQPGCSSLATTSSTADWLYPLDSDIALDTATSEPDVCRSTSGNRGSRQCDEHVRSSVTLDHELPLPDLGFRLRRHLREHVDRRGSSSLGPDLRQTRVVDDALVTLNPATSREAHRPREYGDDCLQKWPYAFCGQSPSTLPKHLDFSFPQILFPPYFETSYERTQIVASRASYVIHGPIEAWK